MRKISDLAEDLFSRQELPRIIKITKRIANLPTAKIGEIFEYRNGFYQGRGDIVIMPHAVRKLKKKGQIEDGEINFHVNHSDKHSLCSA
tara:strand:- start:208 stop:474 length:267 start_codon:yes stop_codon:yes gene_type:complete